MFGNEENDWIVSMKSQLGGLDSNGNPNAITQCSNFSASCDLHHTEVEKNAAIISKISFLLGQKANSNYFTTGGFHPATLVVPPMRDNPMMAPLTPLTMNITNPVMGSSFLSGTEVDFSTVGSSDIALTMFILKSEMNDSTKFEEKVGYSNNFSYTIPANITGRINVVAVGYDASGLVAADTFYFFANAAVLPITLSQFTGKTIEKANLLQWQTATEINTQFFEIERSLDAQNWSSIGTVKAAGNRQTIQNYDFLDEKPASKNYYRLKSVDNDGKSAFSSVIYLSNSKEYELEVFPIPSKQHVTIRYNTPDSETAKVTIYDVVGKLCYTTEIAVDNTSSDYLIDISSLSKGVYLLNFTVNGRNLVSKIIKE
jgi:hypothetical protein